MEVPELLRRVALRASALIALSTLLIAVAGCGGTSPRRASALNHRSQSPSPSSPSASAASAPVAPEPGGGLTLFPSHRLVMFYGAAGTSALGVLGDAPPQVEWPRLAAVAKSYTRPNVVTVPTFELIVWVEQASPGRDGSYSVRVPDSTIARYYDVVHAHHGMLVLDVQPGRHDFLPLCRTLARWLAKPDVGLALDPEWKLYGNQVPDHQIGYTDAADVNGVSSWLSGLVTANHLPQKLLLVHNFTGDMLHHEPRLVFRQNLALAENGDGFGARANKLYDYHLLAADPRLWLGFKLFYRQDIRRYSPAELLAMPEPPDVIDYQ